MPEPDASKALIGKTLRLRDGREIRLARLVNDTRRRGWEAQVYQAVDSQTPEKKFAVKLYGGLEVAGDVYDRACEKASRAYRLGCHLDHASIVATIDLAEHRFLITEWVEGPRLSQVVLAGKYRPQMARAWILALGEALAALTEGLAVIRTGAGHGDVQLTNVILKSGSHNMNVKLFDLDYVGRSFQRSDPGSAASLAWTERFGRKVLKPPEYALGTEGFLDTCSDCFSFGLVAFWLLRRTPAFKKPAEYRQKVSALAEGRGGCASMRYPSGVWELRKDPLGRELMRMTAFDRRDRFQSVADALAALKQVLPGD